MPEAMAKPSVISKMSEYVKLISQIESGRIIMRIKLKGKLFYFLSLFVIVGLGIACTSPASNSTPTTNANETSNANADANGETNANGESTGESSAIEAGEPEEYKATVSINAETLGESKTKIPTLKANVARKGENRWMEVATPTGEKFVYLTIGEKQLVVAPARKQYAELDKEAVGFEVRKLLTPDQIVNQVKAIKGVKKSGEEKYNGKDVIKYTYQGESETNTKAGELEAESYVLVDKETNLPVKSVTVIESDSAQVKGVSGMRITTEISDINTEVDEKLFEEPKDFEKVKAEQVRSQLKAFFDAAQLIVGQMLKSN